MSISDILKKSFLSGYAELNIDVKTILICLFITTMISLYIFFLYRLITRKTFYNKTFNISLIAMAVITAAIILTIQSNIVLSLGMVGALSIIRFRTAIKDPLDLVFLFWATGVGIICGAGLSVIAIIVSLILSVVIFFLQGYPDKKLSKILVVNSTNLQSDKDILSIIKMHSRYYKVKSKNLTSKVLDMVVEVKVGEDSSLVFDIMKLEGIASVALLSHDGEITA